MKNSIKANKSRVIRALYALLFCFSLTTYLLPLTPLYAVSDGEGNELLDLDTGGEMRVRDASDNNLMVVQDNGSSVEAGVGIDDPEAEFHIHDASGQATLIVSTDVDVGSGNAISIVMNSDADGTVNPATIGMFNDGAMRFSGQGNLVAPDMILEDDGDFAIGTATAGARFHVASEAAKETNIARLENNLGNFDLFAVDADPDTLTMTSEAAGDLAVDVTAGDLYIYDGTDWNTFSSGVGLQEAYDEGASGNNITATDARDIEFDLPNGATTDPNFIVDLQDGGDFKVQDAGTDFAVFNDDGSIDFSAATSLEIPNATDPTLDAVGEIAVDTTDNTLTMFDGSAERVIAHDIFQFTATISSDGDWESEAVPIWQAPKDMAVTLVQVDAAVMGTTSPTLDFNLEKRAFASLGSVGTDLLTGEPEADADGISNISISTAAVSATDHIVFTTGNTGSVEGGTVNTFTVTVYYRKDVE